MVKLIFWIFFITYATKSWEKSKNFIDVSKKKQKSEQTGKYGAPTLQEEDLRSDLEIFIINYR